MAYDREPAERIRGLLAGEPAVSASARRAAVRDGRSLDARLADEKQLKTSPALAAWVKRGVAFASLLPAKR